MKRILLIGTIMMAAMMGCAMDAEVSEELDLEETGQARGLFVTPPGSTCTNKNTWSTTTAAVQETQRLCSGYNVVNQKVQCKIYKECTDTSTWLDSHICNDDGTWADYHWLIEKERTCGSQEFNNCTGLLNITC